MTCSDPITKIIHESRSSAPTIGGLPLVQAQLLTLRHLTGDFGWHRWKSIRALFDKGYIVEKHPHVIITTKGLTWINNHHMDVPWPKARHRR